MPLWGRTGQASLRYLTCCPVALMLNDDSSRLCAAVTSWARRANTQLKNGLLLHENPALRALVAEGTLRALAPANPGWLDSINTPEQLAAVKS